MITRIIEYSLKNKLLVVLFALFLVLSGAYSIYNIPIDAIPDLSDIQVIIYTEYPGQAPQVIEDQVTYPLTSSMLAVPKAKVVRGYSFFGFSLVYIIFDDGTDLYWARSRVLEYLNFASAKLPQEAKPRLGPDGTGVGWVYMYTLSDTSGKYDLQQLRALQDWNLKYELQSLQGVAEVASIGGYVKQYQIEVDPTKLILYEISLNEIRSRLARSNKDVGGRLIEMGETEYMVRGLGYIGSVEDIRSIVLKIDKDGNPVTIGDVANVQIGPDIRRGLSDFNGEGEIVSGIVVARFGENALEVIDRVKKRISEIQLLLPKGVKINSSYDRSVLIKRAIKNILSKLGEEMLVVSLVTVIFLLHLRSSLVAVLTLPLGFLASLLLMYLLKINANIMSLGGIAIAIGVMVDASVVLVENLHKHMEKEEGVNHTELVRRAAVEVGPALFYSLLIITVSFLPVLVLEGQSGRLFKPLALTKTFAMGFASLLAITVIPVFMSWFVKGKIHSEESNPVSKFLIRLYKPLLIYCLDNKKTVTIVSMIFLVCSFIPIFGIVKPFSKNYFIRPIGGEFMPPLNEGDILYMPTTLPGLSITKARELLQKTDAIIKSFPEVDHVLGKIGRADTATDPAPLTMIETSIILKDPSEWRKGMTVEKLSQELDRAIQFPGLTNAWTYPIKTRIDMLSTGIKTPVGIKLLGDNLQNLSDLGARLEAYLRSFPGTASVVSERVTGGKYINFKINRYEASRYGLTIGDVQDTIMTAVGGMNITETVEGLARYPVSIRYPREYRDDLYKLKNIWIQTSTGAYIPISNVADIYIEGGPPGIKTENARKTAWLYIDLEEGQDVASYVKAAKEYIQSKIISGELKISQDISFQWSGQFEYMEKAEKRLKIAAVITIFLVFLLLYFHFSNILETIIILFSLSFAVTGGIWLMYVLGFNHSVATDVGFIALAGLAAETGIVMLLYLDEVFQKYKEGNKLEDSQNIRLAVIEGAVDRLRPKMMTVSTTLIGLLPIMWSTDSGSQIMKRLATPMIGGLFTSTLLTLILLPLLYEWIQERLHKNNKCGPLNKKE